MTPKENHLKTLLWTLAGGIYKNCWWHRSSTVCLSSCLTFSNPFQFVSFLHANIIFFFKQRRKLRSAFIRDKVSLPYILSIDYDSYTIDEIKLSNIVKKKKKITNYIETIGVVVVEMPLKNLSFGMNFKWLWVGLLFFLLLLCEVNVCNYVWLLSSLFSTKYNRTTSLTLFDIQNTFELMN